MVKDRRRIPEARNINLLHVSVFRHLINDRFCDCRPSKRCYEAVCPVSEEKKRFKVMQMTVKTHN